MNKFPENYEWEKILTEKVAFYMRFLLYNILEKPKSQK